MIMNEQSFRQVRRTSQSWKFNGERVIALAVGIAFVALAAFQKQSPSPTAAVSSGTAAPPFNNSVHVKAIHQQQQQYLRHLQTFACPETVGESTIIDILEDERILILARPSGGLCTLTLLLNEQEVVVPIARSYDGHQWERAGGKFASRKLQEWFCDAQQCRSSLPAGSYRLQTISTPTTTTLSASSSSNDTTISMARFFEQATFGTTTELLETTSSVTDFIQQQIHTVPATYHREYFRRRAKPQWRVHKPEFASQHNPCAAGAAWRRSSITVKDKDYLLNLTQIQQSTDNDKSSSYWQIAVAGHVRSVVKSFRIQNDPPSEWKGDSGKFSFCNKDDKLMHRGLFSLRDNNKKRCTRLFPDDLLIDFADDAARPELILSETLPALSDETVWKKDTHTALPEYRLNQAIIDNTLCTSLTDLPFHSPPVFAKTVAGEWLIFTPRVILQENIPSHPFPDGGADDWIHGRTRYCGNVPRNMFNERECVLSTTEACRAGSSDPSTAMNTGVVLCPSAGEVGNDSGDDHWLDISSLPTQKAVDLLLPRDTTEINNLARQRENIWSSVVLQSPDQLRQRVAWALIQIFSLSKAGIQSEKLQTESFLNYYDIFVRHAFGNYLDILREVSYNPLMAESLSFLGSKSASATLRETGFLSSPDENYARELMQLFTIGLDLLNMDGTPIPDAEETYNNENIMSFARAWTGFATQGNRANIENTWNNNIDPLRIRPALRDRFPKIDLYRGYLGDYYPLCTDFSDRAFLRKGAKFRLLGRSPVPELFEDDSSWNATSTEVRQLALLPGSELYDRLCAPVDSDGLFCTFPSVVELPENLWYCDSGSTAPECSVEMVRVIKVEDVFFEHVRQPCVELTFYENPTKIVHASQPNLAMCANPRLPVAAEACCEADDDVAHASCSYSGERLTTNTAKKRCESIEMRMCSFQNFTTTQQCPHAGYRWTSEGCRLQVKVKNDGKIAIVHTVSPSIAPEDLQVDSISFFSVHWGEQGFPSVINNSASDICTALDTGECLCDVSASNQAVFAGPPSTVTEILELLRIGHPGPAAYEESTFISTPKHDYSYHSVDGSCCDLNTVFEVFQNGETKFLRNIQSIVTVTGSEYSFRNPPQFNSLISAEYSVADAQAETDVLLQHLFYHQNTAPFVATRLIQRLGGISNPSPRYVKVAAYAFRDGVYRNEEGVEFGVGKYGDIAATVAAVLLDREARSPTLLGDASHGSLKEPILKVTGFMRAMEFEPSTPLIELDLMDNKIGQMAYEQNSVFSFFSPGYSPPGATSSAMLSAPESQVMSPGKVVGLLNGLYSLIEYGLVACKGGFGAVGGCSSSANAGILTYKPAGVTSSKDIVKLLATLLTSGRLSQKRLEEIQEAFDDVADEDNAFRLALRLLVTAPEFHSTIIDLQSVAVPPVQSVQEHPDSSVPERGYKAMIHLFLDGGCDSFNVLVPHGSCSRLHQEYLEARGTIALTDSEILSIDAMNSNQTCSTFGVNRELSFLKSLYDDEDLVFLANIGVLTEPVTIADYSEKTRSRLFAHDAMRDEVKLLDPIQTEAGTGALGRLADVLQHNGFKTSRAVVDSTGTSLAGRSSSPILALDENGVVQLNTDRNEPTLLESFVRDDQHGKMLGYLWSSILGQSLSQTDELIGLLGDLSSSPDYLEKSSLGKKFQLISELISAREARGVERDVFFLTMSGFDTHNNADNYLQELFQEKNTAVQQFVGTLKTLGVWDDVAIVQTSEFGRTLNSNTGRGTDHAWGGNSWVAGGSVAGGRILGEYPSTFTGESDIFLDRGRIIPTLAFDAVFNAIAEWVGGTTVSNEQLDYILPNREQFSNLFSSEELFATGA